MRAITGFKELPNTYELWCNKTTLLSRNVLVEKIDKPIFFESNFPNGGIVFDTYVRWDVQQIMQERIRAQRATAELPKILIEKNLALIKHRQERLEGRVNRIAYMSKYLKNVKSTATDITCDITSLENIDFNRSCTQEEKLNLLEQYDYYVYRDAIDEINCDIKLKDIDGIDLCRREYFRKDETAESIKQYFTNHTIRPALSEEELYEKMSFVIGKVHICNRKVLVEKKNKLILMPLMYAAPSSYKDDEERQYWRVIRNSSEWQQEKNEMRWHLLQNIF